MTGASGRATTQKARRDLAAARERLAAKYARLAAAQEAREVAAGAAREAHRHAMSGPRHYPNGDPRRPAWPECRRPKGLRVTRPGAVAVADHPGIEPSRRLDCGPRPASVTAVVHADRRPEVTAALIAEVRRQPQSAGTLAAALGMNVPALRYHLQRLSRGGQIVADGRSRRAVWRVPT